MSKLLHIQSNFFPGKQEIKPRSECPENMEYYMSEEELQEFPIKKPVRRIWIGSGEDGHLYPKGSLYTEYNGHLGIEMGDLNG